MSDEMGRIKPRRGIGRARKVKKFGNDVSSNDGFRVEVVVPALSEHSRRILRLSREFRGDRAGLADAKKQPARELRPRTNRLYIGSDDAFTAVRILVATDALLRAWGAVYVRALDPEPGSVFVKIRELSRKVARNREVRLRAAQIVQGAEEWAIEKVRSENLRNNMSAAAEFAQATMAADSVAADFGSIQYVQFTDENGKKHIRARTVSSKEIAEKSLDNATLKDPKKLFDLLDSDPDAIGAA